jgi:hypothetical protein
VYTAIGILCVCVCYVGWNGTGTNCDERVSARSIQRLLIVINGRQTVHIVGHIILIYYIYIIDILY